MSIQDDDAPLGEECEELIKCIENCLKSFRRNRSRQRKSPYTKLSKEKSRDQLWRKSLDRTERKPKDQLEGPYAKSSISEPKLKRAQADNSFCSWFISKPDSRTKSKDEHGKSYDSSQKPLHQSDEKKSRDQPWRKSQDRTEGPYAKRSISEPKLKRTQADNSFCSWFINKSDSKTTDKDKQGKSRDSIQKPLDQSDKGKSRDRTEDKPKDRFERKPKDQAQEKRTDQTQRKTKDRPEDKSKDQHEGKPKDQPPGKAKDEHKDKSKEPFQAKSKPQDLSQETQQKRVPHSKKEKSTRDDSLQQVKRKPSDNIFCNWFFGSGQDHKSSDQPMSRQTRDKEERRKPDAAKSPLEQPRAEVKRDQNGRPLKGKLDRPSITKDGISTPVKDARSRSSTSTPEVTITKREKMPSAKPSKGNICDWFFNRPMDKKRVDGEDKLKTKSPSFRPRDLRSTSAKDRKKGDEDFAKSPDQRPRELRSPSGKQIQKETSQKLTPSGKDDGLRKPLTDTKDRPTGAMKDKKPLPTSSSICDWFLGKPKHKPGDEKSKDAKPVQPTEQELSSKRDTTSMHKPGETRSPIQKRTADGEKRKILEDKGRKSVSDVQSVPSDVRSETDKEKRTTKEYVCDWFFSKKRTAESAPDKELRPGDKAKSKKPLEKIGTKSPSGKRRLPPSGDPKDRKAPDKIGGRSPSGRSLRPSGDFKDKKTPAEIDTRSPSRKKILRPSGDFKDKKPPDKIGVRSPSGKRLLRPSGDFRDKTVPDKIGARSPSGKRLLHPSGDFKDKEPPDKIGVRSPSGKRLLRPSGDFRDRTAPDKIGARSPSGKRLLHPSDFRDRKPPDSRTTKPTVQGEKIDDQIPKDERGKLPATYSFCNWLLGTPKEKDLIKKSREATGLPSKRKLEVSRPSKVGPEPRPTPEEQGKFQSSRKSIPGILKRESSAIQDRPTKDRKDVQKRTSDNKYDKPSSICDWFFSKPRDEASKTLVPGRKPIPDYGQKDRKTDDKKYEKIPRKIPYEGERRTSKIPDIPDETYEKIPGQVPYKRKRTSQRPESIPTKRTRFSSPLKRKKSTDREKPTRKDIQKQPISLVKTICNWFTGEQRDDKRPTPMGGKLSQPPREKQRTKPSKEPTKEERDKGKKEIPKSAVSRSKPEESGTKPSKRKQISDIDVPKKRKTSPGSFCKWLVGYEPVDSQKSPSKKRTISDEKIRKHFPPDEKFELDDCESFIACVQECLRKNIRSKRKRK